MKVASPTNDTDFVKCLKSGKWIAKIRHPISKVWVLLGAYTTSEEAADACATKKAEFKSHPLQDTNVMDFGNHPGIKRTKSGKLDAKIKNNSNLVWLGTYNTPREAAKAYNMSKLELQQGFLQEIRNKRKINHYLGKYATAEEAEQIISLKRRNLEGLKAGIRQSDVSQHRAVHAYQRSSGRWQTEIRDPLTKARVHLGTFDTAQEAKEAYNKKRREFDLMASNLNCDSDEPFVPTDGSSVINASKEKENGASMINVNVESIPTFVTEAAIEFDLGIVDSYGQLIGEYSSMDDELWIC